MANEDRIDLDRMINDPDYRRAMIHRLNGAGAAGPGQPAAAADGSRQAMSTRPAAEAGRADSAGD